MQPKPKPTNDPPCESCGAPVPEEEHCGDERPDGTSEYFCPDCFRLKIIYQTYQIA